MKNQVLFLLGLISLLMAQRLPAQGTAFTYQGQLQYNGSPATGAYDFTFALWNTNDLATAQSVGGTLTNLDVWVTNGLFTTTLDFGLVFTGNATWLAVGVRTNGSSSFNPLTPWQALTPTPYALYAPNAGTAASASWVAGSNIVGTVASAQLPAGVLTNGSGSVNLTGVFNGNGAGLTTLTAAGLRGTVPWSSLPNSLVTNYATGLTLSGTFSGNGSGLTALPTNAVINNEAGVTLSGTFSGNGNNLTNVNIGALSQIQYSVVGWGDNSDGETTIPPGLSNVVAVAAGNAYSVALLKNGTVAGWGDNTFGETNIPPGLSNVVAIAAGYVHCLALLSNGTVVGWGDNSTGETNIPAGLTNVVSLAAGDHFSLALLRNGTVVGWGINIFAQRTIPAGLSNVVAIAAGQAHSLALLNNGTVVGWGNNGFYQTNVPPGLTNVVAVAAGFGDSLALLSNGTVAGWGNNNFGNEATVPAGLSNVVAIAAGYVESLALLSNGTVVGWGETPIPAGLSNVVAVAAGQSHGLAMYSQWIPAPAAVLTGNNVFQGSIAAASFSGDGGGLTSLPAFAVTNFESGVTLSGTFSGDGSGLTALPASVVMNNEGGVTLSGKFSGNGSGLTSLPAAVVTNNAAGVTLSGTFSGNGSGLTSLPASVVLNNETGVTLSGTFNGNGSGLTNLPAFAVTNNESGVSLNGSFSGNGSGLTSLPANAALRTGGNAFSGNQTIMSGNVGIGTTTPGTHAVLEVVGTSTGVNAVNYEYLYPGSVAQIPASPSDPINTSIYASGCVVGFEVFAFSDARIKNITGVSDSARDLETLMGIQVTDYTFKDTVAHGDRPQKKVIAQQVEQVYPQAVNRTTDVVPDIYRKATVQDGWVHLDTDLKAGERVKLIGAQAAGVYEVLAVRPGAFQTSFRPVTEQVFVYGREVTDFHTVDYDAIAMLNVSATQELNRQVKAQAAELQASQDKIAALTKANQELARQLAGQQDQTGKLQAEFATLQQAVARLVRPGTTTLSLNQFGERGE